MRQAPTSIPCQSYAAPLPSSCHSQPVPVQWLMCFMAFIIVFSAQIYVCICSDKSSFQNVKPFAGGPDVLERFEIL